MIVRLYWPAAGLALLTFDSFRASFGREPCGSGDTNDAFLLIIFARGATVEDTCDVMMARLVSAAVDPMAGPGVVVAGPPSMLGHERKIASSRLLSAPI